MTEIPEHLLKRSAARRAAAGGGGDAPADAPAADAGAAPAAAAGASAVEKAPAAPAPLPTLEDDAPREVPDIPVVAAAKRRKRVPFWAMPIIVLLPLWGVIYAASMKPPPAGDNDPLVIGKELWTANGCAGCHGVNGEGGTGAVLKDGEVLKTFPDPLEQAYWIHNGAAGAAREDGTYGDPNREGGAQNVSTLPGAMPAFPDLTPEEMAALVIYIREGLSGAKPADDPNFNAEVYAQDPAALAKLVEEAFNVDPNKPDDVTTLDGAEQAS